VRLAVDRSAVVTGAAMGIGEAVAKLLLMNGVHVIAMDIDGDAMSEAFSGHDNVTQVVGDIREWSAHERAAQVAEANAPLGMWVNNAGTNVYGSAGTVTEAQLRSGYDLIAFGPMFGTAVAVRTMLPHLSGAIVTVTSIQGVVAFPDFYIYGTAKAALIQSVRSVAIDYGQKGIRCNAVLPGVVDTPGARATIPDGISAEEMVNSWGGISPMGRVATPTDVAHAVVFLLSEHASYINGSTLTVDGGTTARCFPQSPVDTDAMLAEPRS
jgi:NAD(P)-dependent dehydrogenase (short-subunit alcohol dehydrogenase family)